MWDPLEKPLLLRMLLLLVVVRRRRRVHRLSLHLRRATAVSKDGRFGEVNEKLTGAVGPTSWEG
jgi:hypothetical protein